MLRKSFKDPVLPREFYVRDPKIVAKELLGKVLVRKLEDKVLSGIIVETEAYYGFKDPASRAYGGIKKYSEPMLGKPGITFIYMVHGNWLLNIVTLPEGEASAVLIRALQPLEGVEVMKKNRGTENIYNLTNGPGKLTKALKITKELNEVDVTDEKSPLVVLKNGKLKFRVGASHRIGVKKDLPQKLRFFIEGSPYVSKRKTVSKTRKGNVQRRVSTANI